MFSQAEVQPSKGRLIVDCKEAPETSADLRDPACLAAVLRHLEREFGIEAVVLSHYVEKQYGSRAMEALQKLLALARLVGQMASREPSPNFPGTPKKQVAAKCAACAFNPRALFGRLREKVLGDFAAFHAAKCAACAFNPRAPFGRLREKVLGDFAAFHAEFLASAEALRRYRDAGCTACTAATANDLIYLFREAVNFGEASIEAAPPPPEAAP